MNVNESDSAEALARGTVSSAAGWVAAGLSAVVLAFFFAPWIVNQTMVFESSQSGYDLASTSESAASGSNLYAMFLTPLAALMILVFAIPGLRRSLGVWAPIFTLVLAALGSVPFLTTLPDEIDTWVGGQVTYQPAYWATIGALIAIAVTAVVELAARALEHPVPQPGLQPHLP